MKIKNKALLFCIKIGLDVVWYTHLVASVFMLLLFVKYAYSGSWPMFSMPLRLAIIQEGYSPAIFTNGLTNVGSDVFSMHPANPLIMAIYQNPVIKISLIMRTAIRSVLILAVIYNLRKVFGTIYRNEPFQYKNITRLKMTALYIALPILLNVVYSGVYQLVYNMLKKDNYLRAYNYGYKFKVSWLSWQSTIGYLEVAAIVYIMAEILNYGLELKRENEEFV